MGLKTKSNLQVERSESLENDSVDSNRDGEIGFWEEVDDGILSEEKKPPSQMKSLMTPRRFWRSPTWDQLNNQRLIKNH